MRQLYTGIAGVGFASQTKYTSSESPAECLKAQQGGDLRSRRENLRGTHIGPGAGLRSRADKQANDSGPAIVDGTRRPRGTNEAETIGSHRIIRHRTGLVRAGAADQESDMLGA